MAERYKTVLMFGAPGVGKGTQGKLLGQIPGFHHLATGDMFRSLDRSSELGRKVTQYSSRGELVPDELTIELWKSDVQNRIGQSRYRPQTDLLVLDGIPRSIAQAQAMEPLIEVLRIVHLTASNIGEIIQRMKKRAMKENRQDDADENVIRRRFEVYEQETSPVLTCFARTLIHKVDALGSPAEVLMHVLEAVVPVYREYFDNPLNGGKPHHAQPGSGGCAKVSR
jgi:adenylate kinase